MGGNQITTKRELSFNDKNNITEMIITMNTALANSKYGTHDLNDKFGKRKIKVKSKNSIPPPNKEIKKIRSLKTYKEELDVNDSLASSSTKAIQNLQLKNEIYPNNTSDIDQS